MFFFALTPISLNYSGNQFVAYDITLVHLHKSYSLDSLKHP